MIPEKLIKLKSKEFDLKTILRLDLSNLSLPVMSGLSNCRNMISLNLSRNKIEKIVGFEDLGNLECLDLSFNCLKSIGPLKREYQTEVNESASLPNKLKLLALHGNQIAKIDDVYNLSPLLLLEELSFRISTHGEENEYKHSNPLCSNKLYVAYVMKAFPRLFMLDKECLAFCDIVRMIRRLHEDEKYHSEKVDFDSKWLSSEKIKEMNDCLLKMHSSTQCTMNGLRKSQNDVSDAIDDVKNYMDTIKHDDGN